MNIMSRCWVPYSNQCVFMWKGKDDSKTQLKDADFSQNEKKKQTNKQIRFQIKRDTCGKG